MANILAAQNGNWSSISTWIGGVIPTSADNVYSNNKTITIDVNASAIKICNKAENGATVGGIFNIIGNNTFNINLFDTGATTLCQVSATASPVIYGQVNGGTAAVARGIDVLGSGTLTFVGLVSGGNVAVSSGTNHAEAIRLSTTGNLILSGNSIGGVNTLNHAIHNFGTGNITVYGDLSGSPISTGQALRFYRGGNCTVNGNIYGNFGIGLSIVAFAGDSNIVTINGNSYGPINNTGSAQAFSIASNNGTTTINGNIYGSQGILATAGNFNAASITQGAGNVYVYGDIYGGTSNGTGCGGLAVNGGNFNSPINFYFVGNLYGGSAPWGTANHQAKHALMIDLANANLTCGEIKGGLNSLSNVRTYATNSYGLRVQGAGSIVNVTVPELRMEGEWYSPNIYINNAQATVNITTFAYDDANSSLNAVGYNTITVASGVLNFTGNIYGKDFNVAGITADSARTACAVYQSSSNSTINVNGQLIGGLCGIALRNDGGTTTATKIVGNRYGTNLILANQQASGFAWYGQGASSKLVVDEIQAGSQGNFPASGPIYMKDANSKIIFKQFLDNNLTQTLTDPLSSSTYPLSSDVRYGVSYAGGNLTGSCRVPLPQQVSYGTLVDNTSGSAILDASTLWNFSVSNIPLSGIGGRLKNCATSEIVASQIAAFFP